MNDKYLEKHPESKQSLALVQKEISVKTVSEATNVSPNILNDLVNRYKIFKNDLVSCLGKIAKSLDCDIPPLQEKIPLMRLIVTMSFLKSFNALLSPLSYKRLANRF